MNQLISDAYVCEKIFELQSVGHNIFIKNNCISFPDEMYDMFSEDLCNAIEKYVYKKTFNSVSETQAVQIINRRY